MLMPKRVKFRKTMRGKNRGKALKGNRLEHGNFGLQLLENALITARQIESGRRAISRATKRGGKTYIRIFPHKSMTKRAAESPMGGGKGAPEFWVAPTRRGRIIFEIEGTSQAIARKALKLAAAKLPVKCRFIIGDHV